MIGLRAIFASFLVMALGLAVYAALILLPVETFWYDPGDLVISDGRPNAPPVVTSGRIIKRDFLGAYSGIIRTDESLEPFCSGSDAHIPYSSEASKKTPVVRKPLTDWIGGTCRGRAFPPGRYQVNLCHTVEQPFLILPPKTTCRLRGFNVEE